MCVYRAQGSKIEEFQRRISDLTDIQPPKKSLMLCGDFNIDCINPCYSKAFKTFLNDMHSKHVFPVIT